MTGRRPTRLGGYDYTSNGAYLVTVCTRDRACDFGQVVADLVELSPIGRLVDEAVRSIPSHHRGWELDTHVVMPDHVHVVLFARDRAGQVRPNDRTGQVRPLHDVVGAFKARASRRAGRTLWQRGYHDRIIRNEIELNALREYIATNPLRWSLRNEINDVGVGAGPVRPVQVSIVRAPWR